MKARYELALHNIQLYVHLSVHGAIQVFVVDACPTETGMVIGSSANEAEALVAGLVFWFGEALALRLACHSQRALLLGCRFLRRSLPDLLLSLSHLPTIWIINL